ncbi:hypothetical protein CBW54_02500 [Yersinia kristensenii]|nr:hypothetical protein CBW54_02500 [Yersinia kristensenii]
MSNMREDFEHWANKQPSTFIVGYLVRDGDSYRHPHHATLWECWKISRKNITVRLPRLPRLGSNDEWYQGFAAASEAMRAECATAIRTIGLSIQGE